MATCTLDVASVPGASSAADALTALAGEAWGHAVAGERLEAGATWAEQLARWGDRVWLAGRGPGLHGLPPWNLAATDEDLRRRALAEAGEVLRAAAGRGASHHLLPAGWAVPGPPGGGGTVAWSQALEQLCRSLDAVATLADARGIRVSLILQGPGPDRRLGAHWQELAGVLARLGAPPLGVLADLDAHVAAAARRDDAPLPELAALAPWLHGVRITAAHGALMNPDHPCTQLVTRLPAPPEAVVMAPQGLDRPALRAVLAAARAGWPPPGATG
ncbi:MAG: TIM barrel protein [Candidatus Sericytochromatia bacterium]|nr:TIM barrel protein [Candidatus Sericytochromatia bacterium]